LLPSFRPALGTGAGTFSLVSSPNTRRIAAGGLLALLTLVAIPARRSLSEAPTTLLGLHPEPVLLGAAALVAALAASAGAWRCALRSTGAEIRFREAWGCYGIGSLANALLPARLGEAVRVGLFAARLPGEDRRWVSGGACVVVATARGGVYALTCTAATAFGVLPGWTIAGPVTVAVATVTAIAVVRRRGRGSLARLRLERALAPGSATALLCWLAVAAAARLTGAASILHGLGVESPLRAALVGLTAMAVAGTIPLAPGAAGVASAAMAVVLARTGVPPGTAVAAAVAFHSVETLASVVFGSSGWLAMRSADGAELPFYVRATRKQWRGEIPALPGEGAASLRRSFRARAGRAPRRGGDPGCGASTGSVDLGTNRHAFVTRECQALRSERHDLGLAASDSACPSALVLRGELELVADAVARLDVRVRGVGPVELLAELLDEDVDRSVAMRLPAPPQALEELVAGDHTPLL
jgi:uncharacterized membrane protein YbhN (UPF0104 family)